MDMDPSRGLKLATANPVRIEPHSHTLLRLSVLTTCSTWDFLLK